MSHSEFARRVRASIGFLNRDDELQRVKQNLNLLAADPGHFVVFEVVGPGGAGKSGLLDKVREDIVASKRHKDLAWVSLDAEAASTEVGPLRSIREQLGFDCLLFDAAVLTYWQATGQPFQLSGTSGLGESLVLGSVEIGGTLAGIPLPLSFAADVFKKIRRSTIKSHRYDSSEFQRVDELRSDPVALRKLLPQLLGLDIGRKLDQTARSPVVFYDGYDRQARKTLQEKSPWLRDFIKTLDRGVHLIATREPLNWPVDYWRDVVDLVVVDALPEEQSRELIRIRLGQVERSIEDRLVTASQCIPFFLEAAVDAYETLTADGEAVSAEDLPDSQEGSVEMLLKHLEPGHRNVAIALAAVQFFDHAVYSELLRGLNLQADEFDLEEFVDWFFVSRAEESRGFKTHELLTTFVRSSSSHADRCSKALQVVTRHLVQRSAEIDPVDVDAVFGIFKSLLDGWSALDDIPPVDAAFLVDAALSLNDAGHWNNLYELVDDISVSEPSVQATVVAFVKAVVSRRRHGPEHAAQLLDYILPSVAQLGRHGLSFDVERAYLTELTGDYRTARRQLDRLNRDLVPWNPAERNHQRVLLYNCDMQIMDGELLESSRRLAEVEAEIGRHERVYWGEIVRHRGHAFRFSLLFEDAERAYLLAKRVENAAPGLAAKLYTNFAETYCWTRPDDALAHAKQAIECNERLGNMIEVAKALSARSIALTVQGQVDDALAESSLARDLAADIAYPAAEAFSLIGKVAAYAAIGDSSAAWSSLDDLSVLVQRLGTYGHLAVVGAWLAGARRDALQRAAVVGWIEPDGIEDRLGFLTRQIGI